MYAIIKTGGKQYKVEEGRTLKVEKLIAEVGEEVVFDEVLLVSDGDDIKIGQPTIEGAKVSATVKAQKKDKKVIVFKFKAKKNYRKKKGHRQPFTEVTIDKIEA